MNFRVGRVAELLEQEEFFRVAGDNFFSFLDGAFHALGAFGQHQVSAQGLQQLAAFDAHGFRHGQRQFITARRSHVG